VLHCHASSLCFITVLHSYASSLCFIAVYFITMLHMYLICTIWGFHPLGKPTELTTQLLILNLNLCFIAVHFIAMLHRSIFHCCTLSLYFIIRLPQWVEFSSMPSLQLVQSGIQRLHVAQLSSAKVFLPITPAILLKLKEHWSPQRTDADILMLWSAAILCFFGFFRSLTSFDASKCLAWKDIAVDYIESTDNQSAPVEIQD